VENDEASRDEVTDRTTWFRGGSWGGSEDFEESSFEGGLYGFDFVLGKVKARRKEEKMSSRRREGGEDGKELAENRKSGLTTLRWMRAASAFDRYWSRKISD